MKNIKDKKVIQFPRTQLLSDAPICIDNFLHIYPLLDFVTEAEEESVLFGNDSSGNHSVEIWFDMEGYLSAIDKTIDDISSLILELDLSLSSIIPFYVYTSSSRYIACESDMVGDSLFIDILDIYSQTGDFHLLMIPTGNETPAEISICDFFFHGDTYQNNTVDSIEVTKAPTRICYLPGETFSSQGMEVSCIHSSLGSMRTKDFLVSGNSPLSIVDTSVTITCQQHEISFPISVSDLHSDSPSPFLDSYPTVKLSDGEIFFSLHDISMGENSYLVDVFHSYREKMPFAVEAMSTPCGRGFMLSLDMFVKKENSDRYLFVNEKGEVHSFVRFGQGRYYDIRNPETLLCEDVNEVTITFRGGRILVFDQNGRLIKIRSTLHPNICMRIDRHPTTGRIGLVYDERKYDGTIREECLVFFYNRNGFLSEISLLQNARSEYTSVSFSYDNNGRLIQTSVRKRMEEEYITFPSIELLYNQDGSLSQIKDVTSKRTTILSTQNGSKIISTGYMLESFTQKDRLVIHPSEGCIALIERLNGLKLVYQWDDLGQSMETLQLRTDGTYSLTSLKGEVVSLSTAPGSESFNGEAVYCAPTLGFTFSYDFAEGSYQLFTLSFYIKTLQEDNGGLFLEAYYPETGPFATPIYSHNERTFTPVLSHAIGRWQRIDVPIRFDTGLQREGTPEVIIILRDRNGVNYPFTYSRPIVEPVDLEDISIFRNGSPLLNSTSLYEGSASLSITRNGQTSSFIPLSMKDVANIILTRVPIENTFDIITQNGEIRIGEVSSFSCNGTELFSPDIEVVFAKKSSKVSEGFVDKAIIKFLSTGIAQETRSHIILDVDGNEDVGTVISVTQIDNYGRVLFQSSEDSSLSYSYTASGNLSSVILHHAQTSRTLYQASYDSYDEQIEEERENGVNTCFEFRNKLLYTESKRNFTKRYAYNIHDNISSISFLDDNTLFGFHDISYTDRNISNLSDGVIHHSFLHNWEEDTVRESIGTELRLETQMTPSSTKRTYHRSIEETDVIEDILDPISRYILTKKINGDTVVSYTYEDTNHVQSWRLSQVHDTLSGRESSFSYDVYGNLISATEGNLHISINGNMKEYVFTNGNFAKVLLENDVYGRATKITNNHRRINLVGDNFIDSSATFSYCYDSLGRILEYTTRQCFSSIGPVNVEHTTIYSYGAELLPTQVTYDQFSQMNEEINYDSQHRISSLTKNSLSHNFSYDIAGRLISESIQEETQLLHERSFTYSQERLSSVTTNGNTFVFSYDNKGRLSYISTGNDSLLTMSYDLYGNLTRKSISEEIGIEYTYERGCLLSQVELSINTGNPFIGTLISGTHTFSYDHRGRRTRKDNVEYFYDGENLLAEKRGEEYIFYLYDAQGVSGFSYQDKIYIYIKNILGDVTAILCGDEVIGTYLYDSYGNIISMTDNDITKMNPIRYRGYYYDSETGLYYLRTRYYDPLLMRFLTPDDSSYLDMENLSGLDPYVYCRYDPVMYKDPDGQMPFFVAILILGTIGAVTSFAAQSITDLATSKRFDWGRSGIAAAAGFLGGMAIAIPGAGGIISAALTSGLNTVGQMAYSNNGYVSSDYFAGFLISAVTGAVSSWAFGKLTAGIPFFVDTDFFLSNYVKFVTDWGGIQLSGAVIGRFTVQIALYGFATGMAESFFDLPFSWMGDCLFDTGRKWKSRFSINPILGG